MKILSPTGASVRVNLPSYFEHREHTVPVPGTQLDIPSGPTHTVPGASTRYQVIYYYRNIYLYMYWHHYLMTVE